MGALLTERLGKCLCLCVYCANTSARPRLCVSMSVTCVVLQSKAADLGKERYEEGKKREAGSETEINREEEGGSKRGRGGEKTVERLPTREDRRGLTERSRGGKDGRN